MTTKKKIRNLIIVIAVSVLVILSLLGALVYYIDPFFHYHAPIEGFSYVVDNQLTQNPGMAEHMDYDSVILGSSMTVNFETDWFSELMDLKTLKLSYSSAYPKDISNILEKIYKPADNGNNRNIKNVFLGLDIITYSGDINETKYPIPEYLYDDNKINDVYYLLNKDVLLNYVLRPIVAPEPMNLSHIYASWWTDDYYNEEWVLSNHDAILEPNPVKMDENAFDEAIEANLDVNIIPYIENHPETTFTIFFPPYSILFWSDVMMDNHFEATVNAYRCVEKKLNSYENVKMFFFPDMKDIVCDLNNYADYTHYHPKVNRMMTECFAAFQDGRDDNSYEGKMYYIAKESEEGNHMEDYMEDLMIMLDEYDFSGLRRTLSGYHEKEGEN